MRLCTASKKYYKMCLWAHSESMLITPIPNRTIASALLRTYSFSGGGLHTCISKIQRDRNQNLSSSFPCSPCQHQPRLPPCTSAWEHEARCSSSALSLCVLMGWGKMQERHVEEEHGRGEWGMSTRDDHRGYTHRRQVQGGSTRE